MAMPDNEEVTYWEVFKMGMSAFVDDFRRLFSFVNPFSQQDGEEEIE